MACLCWGVKHPCWVYVLIAILRDVHITLSEDQPSCPTDHFLDNRHDCKPCSICHSGEEPVTSCTNQSDTVCRSCHAGSFSSGKLKCQNCTHCHPGTFVARNCSSTSDTVCKTCAEGTFSSDWSAIGCKPCSGCVKFQTVLGNCSLTQNYKCGACLAGYYKHPNLPDCIPCVHYGLSLKCTPVTIPLTLAGISQNRTSTPPPHIATPRPSSTSNHTSDVLFPPNVSIPIIVTSVVVLVIVCIAILVFNRTISRMCKYCPCGDRSASLRVKFKQGVKSFSEGYLDRRNSTGYPDEDRNRHQILEETQDDAPAFPCLLQFSPLESSGKETKPTVSNTSISYSKINSEKEILDWKPDSSLNNRTVEPDRVGELPSCPSTSGPSTDKGLPSSYKDDFVDEFDQDIGEKLFPDSNSLHNYDLSTATPDAEVPSYATDNKRSLWAYNIAFVQDDDLGPDVALLQDVPERKQRPKNLGRRIAVKTKKNNDDSSTEVFVLDPSNDKDGGSRGMKKRVRLDEGESDSGKQDVFLELEFSDEESFPFENNDNEVKRLPLANARLDSGIADV